MSLLKMRAYKIISALKKIINADPHVYFSNFKCLSCTQKKKPKTALINITTYVNKSYNVSLIKIDI